MANSNDVANNNQMNYCFIFTTCCIQSSVEKGNDSANRKKMREEQHVVHLYSKKGK